MKQSKSSRFTAFLKNQKMVILSFLIPFVMMLLAFIAKGIYPFGDRQVMVVDMWHQYFPFLTELRHKIVTGGSLFYTWDGGLGTNFLGTLGYYAASPFYLLSPLFSEEHLIEGMALFVLMKIGACGATFAVYLRGVYKRDDISTVIFSCFYALCAFVMGYYWNIIWLDCVAMLPLIMLGLHAFITEGKFKLYVISLGLTLLFNYYIGTFVCIFTAFYFIKEMLSRYKMREVGTIFKKSLKALVYSLLGCSLAAVLLLPTMAVLQNASASTSTAPTKFKLYHGLLEMFNNMFPAMEPTNRKGLPNIACGALCLMLALIYLFCEKIPLRRRVSNGVLAGFLLLSLNINYLDYIWHGFHFPNELPGRFSFCFSFLVVNMAYDAFVNIDSIKKNCIVGVAAGGAAYVMLMQAVGNEKFTDLVVYLSLAFFVIYGAALYYMSTKKRKRAAALNFIFLIALCEFFSSAMIGSNTVGSSARKTYANEINNMNTVVDYLYAADNDFYRLETAETYTINNPALYSYRGVSLFSSTANSHVTTITNALGLAGRPKSNRYSYRYCTPVVNSMLGIKYIMTDKNGINDPLLTPVNIDGNFSVYKYKYFMPVAYMTDDDIRDWDISSGNPFEVQNDYISRVTGGAIASVFKPVEPAETEFKNLETDEDAVSVFPVTPTSTSKSQSATLTYTATGKDMYVYVSSTAGSDLDITIGDEKKSHNISYAHIITLGQLDKGEKITLHMDIDIDKAKNITAYVCELDEVAFERAYEQLEDGGMRVTKYSDTMIEGSVTAEEDGVLYTSIPYEKGWKAYVDGKRVDIEPLCDGLVSLNMTKGEHTVKFKFMPQGFVPGLLISAAGIAVLVMLILSERKNKAPVSVDAPETEPKQAEDTPESESEQAEDAPANESEQAEGTPANESEQAEEAPANESEQAEDAPANESEQAEESPETE